MSCFSAAKLFFAYGLGNGMNFPMSVGATAILYPDRPTPDVVQAMMKEHNPRSSSACRRSMRRCWHPQHDRGAGSSRLRLCVSAGEALPEDIGNALAGKDRHARSSTASARPRCCTSSSRTARASALWHLRHARSDYEARLSMTTARPCAPGEIGELVDQAGRRRLTATGTSASSRGTFAGSGRTRATSTASTSTAATSTADAPTTCSRSAASGCRRSRSSWP